MLWHGFLWHTLFIAGGDGKCNGMQPCDAFVQGLSYIDLYHFKEGGPRVRPSFLFGDKGVIYMSICKVEHLSHRFEDKVLYQDASFTLYKGQHLGVTGPNGVGKSTLLRILLGEVVPDAGRVQWQKNTRIGHLDQYAGLAPEMTMDAYLHTAFAALYKMEARMQACYEAAAQSGEEEPLHQAARLQQALLEQDFYSADTRIQRVAAGLGLTALGMERTVGTLSGGQRAKLILAKLLLQAPDVLLLDEPTNFLDQEHIAFLARFLRGFDGAFLVVSHDTAFLQAAVNGLLDIDGGTLHVYHGDYASCAAQKAHMRADLLRRYQAQQKHIQRTEAYIRKNIAGVNTRMAQGRRKQLARLERIAPPSEMAAPRIAFPSAPLSVQRVLTVERLSVGYERPLLAPLDFQLYNGEKVVITGFNGIGKSTLLKTLVGQIAPLGGTFRFAEQTRLGYYEQDLRWASAVQTPLQILGDAAPHRTQKELRQVLARCNVRAEHADRAIGTLSGGEQSKVKLCLLLLRPVNCLFLDEPTNHLDAVTKQALQQALSVFAGNVLLVCHEPAFYQSWADRVLDIRVDLAHKA